jgi:hypothetical protein
VHSSDLTRVLGAIASDEAQRLLYALTQREWSSVELAGARQLEAEVVEALLEGLQAADLVTAGTHGCRATSCVEATETADEIVLQVVHGEMRISIGRPRHFYGAAQ